RARLREKIVVQRPQKVTLSLKVSDQVCELVALVDRRRMKTEPQWIAYAVRLQNIPGPLDMEPVQPLWQARGQIFLYRASVLMPESPRRQDKEVVVHHD